MKKFEIFADVGQINILLWELSVKLCVICNVIEHEFKKHTSWYVKEIKFPALKGSVWIIAVPGAICYRFLRGDALPTLRTGFHRPFLIVDQVDLYRRFKRSFAKLKIAPFKLLLGWGGVEEYSKLHDLSLAESATLNIFRKFQSVDSEIGRYPGDEALQDKRWRERRRGAMVAMARELETWSKGRVEGKLKSWGKVLSQQWTLFWEFLGSEHAPVNFDSLFGIESYFTDGNNSVELTARDLEMAAVFCSLSATAEKNDLDAQLYLRNAVVAILKGEDPPSPWPHRG